MCPFNIPVIAAKSSRWQSFMRTSIIGACQRFPACNIWHTLGVWFQFKLIKGFTHTVWTRVGYIPGLGYRKMEVMSFHSDKFILGVITTVSTALPSSKQRRLWSWRNRRHEILTSIQPRSEWKQSDHVLSLSFEMSERFLLCTPNTSQKKENKSWLKVDWRYFAFIMFKVLVIWPQFKSWIILT